ncbi:UDP-glucose 4-epimerase family protein [Devosia chinhatensis]|nr:SDR family oxidoreductase [Devosia chinhatensis]
MLLVTGAGGFVGAALLDRLRADAKHYRAISRTARPGIEAMGAIDGSTDWSAALQDVDTVIHLAARVHVMRDRAADPLEEFRTTNVAGTLGLARQAAAAGVRRMIFVSSIKVNGEETRPGRPFLADDQPDPQDAYGISKWEAEQELHDLARMTGIEIVVVRPVLVYGPGVGGNFIRIVEWVRRGYPLPLAMVRNQRSFVYVGNLVDLIMTCIDHPAAANETFLASDGADMSTPQLVRVLARHMNRNVKLLPVPIGLLRLLARVAGQKDAAVRLTDSLQVDIAKNKEILGWSPRFSLDQGMQDTVRDAVTKRK